MSKFQTYLHAIISKLIGDKKKIFLISYGGEKNPLYVFSKIFMS